MRNTFKLLSLLMALVAVAGLQSCSKHDKGDVLDYVPADASVIVYGDLNYVMEKSGISENGKIGEPLKSVLEQNKVDLTEYKKDLAVIKDFTRESALFVQGEKVWVVAGLADAKDLVKYLEKEHDFDVSKENGVQVLYKKGNTMMVKNDMLFCCIDLRKWKPVDNTSAVNELCDLGDESFLNSDNTKELAKQIIESDQTLFALANLGKLSALIDDRDFDQFKTGLSMVYNNPTYIAADLKVSDTGITSTVKVLDSKYAPAKCSLTLGQIDAKTFSYAAVPDNTALIALALPSQLISQITGAASKFLPAPVISAIKCINGTLAMTVNPAADTQRDMFAVAVTTNGNADAVKLGQFVSSIENTLKCSTSDKYLRVVLNGGPAPSGKTDYAASLQGKPAGMVADLGALLSSFGIRGDFSKLGTAAVYADTADGSLSIKGEWKCENPVQRIFDIANNAETIFNALDNYGEKFSYQEQVYVSAPVDSTFGGYDEDIEFSYSGYEPEPDYMY